MTKLKPILGAILLAASLSSTAFADEALTPEKRKAAEEVLATMDTGRIATQLKELVFRQWMVQVSRGAPQAIKEDKALTEAQKKKLMDNGDKVMKIMGDDFRKALDKVDTNKIVREALVNAYGKELTEKELKEIAAFNNTPTGKKLQQIQPQMAADTMKASVAAVSDQLKYSKPAPFTDVVKKLDAK